MKKLYPLFVLLGLSLGLNACSFSYDTEIEFLETSVVYTFEENTLWTRGASDYAVGKDSLIQFEAVHENVPNTNTHAMRISCKNIDDDVFVFVQKQINFLKPNKRYQVNFFLDMNSKYPLHSEVGKSAVVKVGIVPFAPQVSIQNQEYILNIPKGEFLESTPEMLVVDYIHNNYTDATYISRTLASPHYAELRTNASGRAWVVVGIESKYADKISVYLERIKIVFREIQ